MLAGGAVTLVAILDRQLTRSSDDVSQARVRDLLAQARTGGLPPLLTDVGDDSVAQVIGSDGTVLAASGNVTGRPAIVSPTRGRSLEVHTFRGPDDNETEVYRAWVQSGPAPSGEITAVAGTSLEASHEATARLRTALYVGVPLAIAVLGLGVWLVLGRALGRLDRIRAEVDAIGSDQLDRRVATAGPPDEVGRLAATMNRMLARIEASVTRQRQLVADVSHDLQSPLATQRLALELELRSPDAIDRERLRADVLGATEEMERLVDDLVVLAAADENAPVATASVDLDVIVLEEAARARARSPVGLDTSRVSAGPVHGNADELRRIVRNLVGNATTYARDRVELALGTRDGTVTLDVVDDGPGVPSGERAFIFDRFRRGDRARSRNVPGSGLGLAIARSLAVRAGGRLDLLDGEPGAHFRLTLPALPVDVTAPADPF